MPGSTLWWPPRRLWPGRGPSSACVSTDRAGPRAPPGGGRAHCYRGPGCLPVCRPGSQCLTVLQPLRSLAPNAPSVSRHCSAPAPPAPAPTPRPPVLAQLRGLPWVSRLCLSLFCSLNPGEAEAALSLGPAPLLFPGSSPWALWRAPPGGGRLGMGAQRGRRSRHRGAAVRRLQPAR